jgi:hypothetical protein
MIKTALLFILLLPCFFVLGQSKNQHVSFSTFSLNIHNFYSECYSHSRNSEEIRPTHAKFDTVFLCETPCEDTGWYINGQTLKVHSKREFESFELYLSTEYLIASAFDNLNKNMPDEGWEARYKRATYIQYFSKEVKLRMIKPNIFKIPSPDVIRKHASFENIKKRYGFKDTIIEVPQEVGVLLIQFYKGIEYYTAYPQYYKIKINRFIKGHLVETKYVTIGISEGCD